MAVALSFGSWLKQRRQALGLTQEALAERVGCAAETLRKLEANARRPSVELARRVADAVLLAPMEHDAFVQWARAPLGADRPATPPPTPLLAPLPTTKQPLTNLPVLLTQLIGRTDEVMAVCELLGQPDVRLVTLTGVGGIGKARLALHVGAELLAAFDDGVWFANLAPISDPALVAGTIAQALGVNEVGGRPLRERLTSYLSDRRLLLILDNFEQVLTAAQLVAELVHAAPKLRVLVTSRIALHLYGEHTFVVPPLAVPAAADVPPLVQLTQVAAVALFIQRAQAVRPDFAVTNANAQAVAAICARLDGVPLAIELAAARSTLLPPQALLARLRRRLGVLTGGARDQPTRQRTLRHTVDWSYLLLDPAEQTLFARLAVFVGGCSLDAAEAVCGEESGTEEPGYIRSAPEAPAHVVPRVPVPPVLDGLAALVDHSLLQPADGADGIARVRMLETIREYALERLEASGEADTLRRRHAAYFLALAEAAEPELQGPQQMTWLARLEADNTNLRAALAWTVAYDEWETAARLSGRLWRFWVMSGRLSEGRNWLAAVLAQRTSVSDGTQAQALHGAGNLAFRQGDLAAAQALYEQSLAMKRALNDQQGIANLLNNLGAVGNAQGEYAAARGWLEESLAMRRELGDRWGIAVSLITLGDVAFHEGDYAVAHTLLVESLVLLREVGDSWASASALVSLGGCCPRKVSSTQRTHSSRTAWHSIVSWATRGASPRRSSPLETWRPDKVTSRRC